MVFIGQRRRGPGRFLHWKMRLLAVGAVLLLVGMAREMDLLVLLSIVVLAGAFALRFFERDEPHEAGATAEDDESDEPPAD
jgi:Na+-transporting methylmalonyl-CoA/oxaloacetate decarboxylase gamma subunit